MSKFLLCKVAIIIIAISLFFSCTTNGNIVFDYEDSGAFYFDTTLTENLDKTIRAFGDVEDSHAIFSESLIKDFFKQAGVTVLSVEMQSPKNISFSGFSSEKENLQNIDQPIIVEKSNELSEFSVVFSEETIMPFVSTLDEDSLMYIDLFQAPLFTREEMTAEEYEEFIAALYGQTLSNDLQKSYIDVEIKTPKKINSIQILPENLATYKITPNSVVFSIKLSELLANSSEALLQITW